MPKKKQTFNYPKIEESSSEKKEKKKSRFKSKEKKPETKSNKLDIEDKEKYKQNSYNKESNYDKEKNLEMKEKNKDLINKFYVTEKEEKENIEKEFEEYKKEDDIIIEIDNNLDLEKDTENDIQEDLTKGEEINDKKLLGISDSEVNEDQIKEEKTLNNNTNPFIKEENKIKFNEDIEIFSEEEKEEKETEEKENEENIKNKLQATNKLCIIDSKFIEAEGKIIL